MEAIVEGSAAVIPRFQHEDHGFSFQSNGDMDSHHSYSFQSCKATLVFFGRKVMEVGDNGRTLYMQGRQFPLGKDRLVLLVTPEGDFRQLTGAEAKRLEDSLHPWFRTFEHSDYPHELLRRPYQPLP